MREAQKRLDEIEAQEQALADEKAKLLLASKDADLELVKKLCKITCEHTCGLTLRL